MKEQHITRVTLDQAMALKDQTDWERFTKSDAGDEMDFDWDSAVVVVSPVKEAVSLRLDAEVLAFFRAGGKGYQTRINEILKSYVRTRHPDGQ